MSEERDYDEAVRMVLDRAGAEGVIDTSEGYMAQCLLPTHDDSTASFAINASNGLWRCYGCKEHGNLPQLMSTLFGLTGPEATRQLRQYENRNMFPTLEEEREKAYKQVYMDERVLIPYSDTCPVHMLDRGFSKDFLRRFEMGFDRTGFVVFPIRDINGRLVGITRRTIHSHVEPKYKHSFGWRKADHLYLGHYAAQNVTSDPSTVVLVEGHVDALRMWQLMEENSKLSRLFRAYKLPVLVGTGAIMGSSLSETQARLVTRRLRARTVVCAFDNDKAGQEVLWGTERQREKRTEDRANKRTGGHPIGAVEALLAVGVRSIYALRFDGKDPGGLAAGSDVELDDLT